MNSHFTDILSKIDLYLLFCIRLTNVLWNSLHYKLANGNQYRFWPHYVWQKEVCQCSYNQQHYVVVVVFNVVIMLKMRKVLGCQILRFTKVHSKSNSQFFWLVFSSQLITYSVLSSSKIKPFLPEIGKINNIVAKFAFFRPNCHIIFIYFLPPVSNVYFLNSKKTSTSIRTFNPKWELIEVFGWILCSFF